MVTSKPDFTAVMRLSTINPTGTLRSRKAINSVKVTRAPENSARIQTLKKLITTTKATKATRNKAASAKMAKPLISLPPRVSARSKLAMCIAIAFDFEFFQSHALPLCYAHDDPQAFDGDDFDRCSPLDHCPIAHHIHVTSVYDRNTRRAQIRVRHASLVEQLRLFRTDHTDCAL